MKKDFVISFCFLSTDLSLSLLKRLLIVKDFPFGLIHLDLGFAVSNTGVHHCCVFGVYMRFGVHLRTLEQSRRYYLTSSTESSAASTLNRSGIFTVTFPSAGVNI